MVVVEWRPGSQLHEVRAAELDALLDRVASKTELDGKPQDVQVTVETAGTLGIVVGAQWNVLQHVPPNLNPPYMVSVGHDGGDERLVFYVAGDQADAGYCRLEQMNEITADGIAVLIPPDSSRRKDPPSRLERRRLAFIRLVLATDQGTL